MNAIIRELVTACSQCQLAKPAQNAQMELMATKVPTTPMEKLYIDYVGTMVRIKKGNAQILVVVDWFTKFVWLNPTRDATANSTTKVLQGIFAVFAFPKYIASDQGSAFRAQTFHDFCCSYGIRHVKSSAYYPQGNLAERVNRNLKSALIAYHAKSQTS